MKINTVVNSTIVQLLNRAADEIQEQGGEAASESDMDMMPPRPSPKMKKAAAKSKPSSASCGRKKKKPVSAAGSSMLITDKIRDDAGYRELPSGKGGSGKTPAISEYNPDDVLPTAAARERPSESAIFSDVEAAGSSAEADDYE
jgi:hypothetical protein